MQPVSLTEARSFHKNTLASMVVEQSEQLAVALRMIRKLEHEVARLSMELGAQNQQVLLTAAALERMRQATFGRSSERRIGGEAPLFDGLDGRDAEDGGSDDPKPAKKKREKFGRTPQPGLPLQDVHSRIAEEDVKGHGLIEWDGQYEMSELITVIPSQLVLQRWHRHKYFRTDPVTGERQIVTAPGPLKLKEGSRYSLEFAVEAGLAKYQWHLPLERQKNMMAGQGLEIGTNTLFEQIDSAAWYLRPTVFKGIVERIKSSYVTQADDTTWKNLEKLATRERKHFHLWAVMSNEAICYNVYDSRSQQVAKNFLGDLCGVLVSDGHASFKALASDKLTLANDWYHVRRKFIAAEKTYAEEAKWFVDRIRDLGDVEKALADKPPDEIYRLRQERSKPIVAAIRERMDGLAHILPESSLGKALKYTDKLWGGLTVFLADPLVPMHTNDIERGMRGPAIGRKNHFGSKNIHTARVAAVWYTIIETCKMHGVDPRDYIVETLKAILRKKPYKMPWDFGSPADVILD